MGTTLNLALFLGCQPNMTASKPSAPRRDINTVLADHDQQLLTLPGVVGVYVGLLEDDKTPCLKVMLVRKDRKFERSLPRSIEGYPVVAEVTGEIKPMTGRQR